MKKNILKMFIINIVILSLIAYTIGLTDSAFRQVYPSEMDLLSHEFHEVFCALGFALLVADHYRRCFITDFICYREKKMIPEKHHISVENIYL